jgi:excisionase family DNA binding protein
MGEADGRPLAVGNCCPEAPLSTIKPTGPALMVGTDAAAYQLGVAVEVIWRLIHSKRLPAAKIGAHWRIKQSDLDALMAGEL